ncbi:hypothetical protein NIES2098_42090 [Calothrix sp. NIES-2098]|nr:hypothetical protein NIES2098_42090 [Calothrix sp. NIES-2098]
MFVLDSTLLSASKIYLIEGHLYRYSHKSGTIQAPQFHFYPLGGQRRKASLTLNKNRLRRVEETSLRSGEIHPDHIQLSLL